MFPAPFFATIESSIGGELDTPASQKGAEVIAGLNNYQWRGFYSLAEVYVLPGGAQGQSPQGYRLGFKSF
jgi:hypothetical protein